MDDYSVENFLNRCKNIVLENGGLDYYVSNKYNGIESVLKRTNEKDPYFYRIRNYEKMVGGFLFLLRTGVKDYALTDIEFDSYKPIIELMVEKGHLKKSILTLFKE